MTTGQAWLEPYMTDEENAHRNGFDGEDHTSLDCGACGLEFDPRRPDGMYGDDEEFTCIACRAVNQIGVDDDNAYVSHWTCRHGKDDETHCGRCEIEGDDVRSLAVLASNLAQAGALCEAWDLGNEYGSSPAMMREPDEWRPNVNGKAA